MQELQEIDIQIWDYLDGRCDEQEMQRIKTLIDSDGAWQMKYTELSALHEQIMQTSPEQPSVRFTKNVMEAISSVQVAKATRKYLNPKIIQGIAAGFIMAICALLVYALTQTHWQDESSQTVAISGWLKQMEPQNLINLILLVNAIAALVLIDTIIRRRRKVQE